MRKSNLVVNDCLKRLQNADPKAVTFSDLPDPLFKFWPVSDLFYNLRSGRSRS